MTHADIVRTFSFTAITAEQEDDLVALHTAACELATVIYRVVSPQQAQNAIAQLVGITSQCRMAIEITPRTAERRIELVTQ